MNFDLDFVDVPAETYLSELYGKEWRTMAMKVLSDREASTIDQILRRVVAELDAKRPRRYVIGLALDFAALAVKLEPSHQHEPALTEGALFSRYSLVTARGGTKSNTLSFTTAGGTVGIRAEEERVRALFYQGGRTQYPSAYVYNTGQWPKYKELLVEIFSLSDTARICVVLEVIRLGYRTIGRNEFLSLPVAKSTVFSSIISGFSRSQPGENGGSIFQAICFAYFATDRPHLQIVSSGTRTGSRRQSRIGDIDCFSGHFLAQSIEVKDISVTSDNIDHQLNEFIQAISDSEIHGTVLAKTFDEASKQILDEFEIGHIDERELLGLVANWDADKQRAAAAQVLFFLYHIEGNQKSGDRLQEFITSVS
jgi:hypothetical protein